MISKEKIEKIKALEESEPKESNKKSFDKLRVCYLGVPVKEHFPKVSKDVNGKVVRSDTSDGYSYVFSEIATSTKVMVILPKKIDLDWMDLFLVSGMGYQMRNANMIYLDEKTQIFNIK